MKDKDLDEQGIWGKYGREQKIDSVSLGPHTSFQLKKSPRRLLFGLARYKFAQKMIGNNKNILELGCSDGFYTCALAENANRVLGVDFDEEAIDWAKENLSTEKLFFRCENFLDEHFHKYHYHAVVSFDVIEHILKENEDIFLSTICDNLRTYGIAIIGTPNILAMKYSSETVRKAHVNEYGYKRLETLMNKYFHYVFIFSQNDEVIHTGFSPMAHYLIAVGCCKKERQNR